MHVFPKTSSEWLALPLFPFKAWVVTALPVYLLFGIYSASQVPTSYNTGVVASAVVAGYVLSAAALLLGALVQSIFCERGTATRTAAYAAAGIILVWLMSGL